MKKELSILAEVGTRLVPCFQGKTDHYDHILVGCPEFCPKAFWDYADVMLITIVAGHIIKELEKEGVKFG